MQKEHPDWWSKLEPALRAYDPDRRIVLTVLILDNTAELSERVCVPVSTTGGYVVRRDRTVLLHAAAAQAVPRPRKGKAVWFQADEPKVSLAFQRDNVFTCARPECRKPEKKENEFRRCAGCSFTPYCSKECQRADYSRHQAVCPRKDLAKKGKSRPHSESALDQHTHIDRGKGDQQSSSATP